MEIPCTGPAINLFIGRICKYPSRNITSPPPPRKSRANTFRLPYGFISHLLVPHPAREKKNKKRVFTFIVVGDAFYEIHVGVVKRELRKWW